MGSLILKEQSVLDFNAAPLNKLKIVYGNDNKLYRIDENNNVIDVGGNAYKEIATITYNGLNSYIGYPTYYQDLSISGETPLTSVVLFYETALNNSVWNNNVDFLPRIVDKDDNVIFESTTSYIDVEPNTKIYYKQVKDYILDLSELSIKWNFSNSVQGNVVSNSAGEIKIYGILRTDLNSL
jgi:hypothetical protein